MLRIIHTLGGCGGTLLSRCLGVLPEVAVLSEVNPASVKVNPNYNPLYQDRVWLHLLTESDVERFSGRDLDVPGNFLDLIQVFHNRAAAANRHLVIRDWNFVEFIGVPYNPNPPRRLLLYRALPPAIPTAAFAFIRHPVDQWLSLSKHLQPQDGMTPRVFCDGYAAFLRELASSGVDVFKYEEFLDDPDNQLRAMCAKLELRFESSFRDRFHQFAMVTGDFERLNDPSITPPAPKQMLSHVMDQFRSSESYHSILEKAGYSDRSCGVQELV